MKNFSIVKVKIDLWNPDSIVHEYRNVFCYVKKLPSGFYHLKSLDGGFEDLSMLFDTKSRSFYGAD